MRHCLTISLIVFSPGETLLSPLVMCGPHGLKFRKPIELRLPHKGASNDSMAFSLKSSDSPVGKFIIIFIITHINVLPLLAGNKFPGGIL